ncbi:hypothetical protein PENTCL1PPCAC_10074, partial [Pristionchus entomophagus]
TDATQMQMFDRDYGAQCPLCKMYYQGAHSLSEHIATVHRDFEGKLFECDQCDKSYRHFAHLRAHKHTKHLAPMKFKRTKKCRTSVSKSRDEKGEEKEEVHDQEDAQEPEKEMKEEESGSDVEEESDSYLLDCVMMSDIDSESE